MFADPPSIYLVALTIVATIFLTLMFLNQVREEHPEKYEEISGPGQKFDMVVGPFYLGLVYIVPLDYESWQLSPKATWIGRALVVLNISYLALIIWILISLLHI